MHMSALYWAHFAHCRLEATSLVLQCIRERACDAASYPDGMSMRYGCPAFLPPIDPPINGTGVVLAIQFSMLVPTNAPDSIEQNCFLPRIFPTLCGRSLNVS